MLEALLAILVIELTFLRIGKDFVSGRDVFESICGFWVVGILVWLSSGMHLVMILEILTRVMLECTLLVGCLQLGVIRRWVDLVRLSDKVENMEISVPTPRTS